MHIIDAGDFGISGDSDEDQRLALQHALEVLSEGPAVRLQLPPGRIVIGAPTVELDAAGPWLARHLAASPWLSGPAAAGPWLYAQVPGHLEVVGAGAAATTLVRRWHGRFDNVGLPPLLAVEGRGAFRLADLAIDADPLLCSAGVVEAVDPIRVRILPGHPVAERMVACQVGIADREGRLIAGKIDWSKKAHAVRDPADPGVMVIGGDRLDRQPMPGEVLFWYFAVDGGSCLAFDKLSTITMENIDLCCTNGFVVHLRDTGATTLRRLDFSPPPGRVAAHPRDLVHGTSIIGDVLIEDCVFAGAQDDGINLHSYYLQVAERRDDRTCLMRGIHLGNRYIPSKTGWAMELYDGGNLDFLDAGRQPAHAARIATHAVEGHANLVTCREPLPAWVQAGTWVDPRCTLPPSTVIRRCTFRDLTSRGIKCSVHDCLIEDCTFTNITSPGLHLTGEFDWEESASPCRVLVRRCTFDHCDFWDLHGYFKRAALLIQPKDIPGGARVCRDIRIEDCAFSDYPQAAIATYHAADVVVRGCRFSGPMAQAVWHDPASSDAPLLLGPGPGPALP